MPVPGCVLQSDLLGNLGSARKLKPELPQHGEAKRVSVPRAFPDGSAVKNPPANAGDAGSIPALGRRKQQPTPVFLPGKSHGQRNLVGYSLWGHRELDTT